jgi:hypothetical protein
LCHLADKPNLTSSGASGNRCRTISAVSANRNSVPCRRKRLSVLVNDLKRVASC